MYTNSTFLYSYLINLLCIHKDEKSYVHVYVLLHDCYHTANSVISALFPQHLVYLICMYGLLHEQICFYKFLSPICYAQQP